MKLVERDTLATHLSDQATMNQSAAENFYQFEIKVYRERQEFGVVGTRRTTLSGAGRADTQGTGRRTGRHNSTNDLNDGKGSLKNDEDAGDQK